MKAKLEKSLDDLMKELHEFELINDQTMREFDALSLPKVKEYSPTQIQRIRKRNKASQAVFAAYLNTNLSTIQKWEQGQKKPNGISLKLISLVDRFGLGLLAA